MKGDEPNYNSPYGDLQEPRPQHSTFAYDDRTGTDNEESRGLIKDPIDESDLAMAVVDILSCCDGRLNPNQAKLLKDMESRYQENGNLTPGEDEQQQEEFSDEGSILQKISPAKLLRGFGNHGQKYTMRSSRGITGELPVRKDTLSAPKYSLASKRNWKIFLITAAVFLVVAVVVLLLVMQRNRLSPAGPTSQASNSGLNMTPLTTDCIEVSKQANPHVLSQCACKGSITEISEGAKVKYNNMLHAFGAEYLHANETMASCSSRNQALVWLAEDEGSTLSDALIQRHVLVLFFVKLHGLHWTLEEGRQEWLTPDHECTWHGIACNGNKEVTAIDLWNLNLEGSIPKEIMSLTSLKTLSLPENRIRGHLPTDAFVMLPKLTDLTLFMNSISGHIDGRILDTVTQLRTFNMDSNDLTGPIPTEIGKLSALEELKLARNNLKGSIPTELGNAKLLQKIEVEENNLYGTLPSEMGKLYLLKSLNLSWNNLQGTIPWEFQDFRNLVDLFLKNNNFGGTLPEVIKVLDKLENLVVSFNAFTGELPSGMEHMVSLTTVHLDENRFNGTIPAALGACTMLRDLKLEYNDFHGAIPTELGRLSWLISLNLEGNSFAGVMPQEVCNLRGNIGTLDSLSATCTAATESGRDKELFVRPNEFICAVPDCCTVCKNKG